MFKFIGHHWQRRRERFYLKNRWHLILDFSLGLVTVILAATLVGLHYYQPVIDTQIQGNPLLQPEYDVNNPPLNISLNIATSSVRLADGVTLKINLKNSGQQEVKNVRINLLTTNRNFAIEKIKEVANQENRILAATSNREIIVSSVPGNKEIDINFQVSFADKTKIERVIKWQAQTQYEIEGQVIKELINLTDIILAAELSAEAVAYYNSPQGDQLGSGPIPPVIGIPTNYWIFFEVKSSGDFNNLVFSGKLPKGVELTERRSVLAGDFKYNASSRKVIWTVPELKNQSDSYRVGFEVQFIPTASQQGNIANLMTELQYYAHDILIKDENTGILSDLDTNLISDRINKGQGRVDGLNP